MVSTKKHTIQISEDLYQEIKEYCQINKLKLNDFIDALLIKSFNLEKFGDAPFMQTPIIIPIVKEKEDEPQLELDKITTNLIFDEPEDKPNNEVIKQDNNIPTYQGEKVIKSEEKKEENNAIVKKPNKRRLK